VTHIGDVGHTLVAGPTGMGKSVLLAMLAMQFRRYRGSRIFAFDMGRSMRATILGLGGEHYDLGAAKSPSSPRPHRPRGLPHLGRRMDRRPPAA
jgi:type IV secretory pathway VirB4 component